MKTYQTKVSKYFSEKTTLGEVLQVISKLDAAKVADAAYKGAVWVQKNSQGKILRERNTQFILNLNDSVSFYYDAKVLSLPELKDAEVLLETPHFGVWRKVAGIVSQGTQAGDHSSLLRFVEKKREKDVYLIHRLDRETDGLMIVGYTKESANKLGDLFQKNQVKKIYEAVVLGSLPLGHKQTITASLDDKEAITHIQVRESAEMRSLLRIEIETGRFHQIRRHLDHIGHPVMGDPKYGKGNKNREGLKLLAYSMSFIDPWTKKEIKVALTTGLNL